MNKARLLVCGGRAFADRDLVFRVLDGILRTRGVEVLIHGGARGADSLADEWADERYVMTCVYPAEWDRFGRSAGVRRNALMLKHGKPTLAVAFLGGVGTADMVARLRAASIPLIEPRSTP